MIALLQTSQKTLLELAGWAVGTEAPYKFGILQPCMSTFGRFGLPGSFLPDISILTSVTEPLENIMWDKNIFCQCCVLT